MVDKTTGYIKINRFAEKTYDEFLSGLTQLKKEGAKHIIIDLRDNGGGYLESAVAIADEFLENKELIVKTKNKKDVQQLDRSLNLLSGKMEIGEEKLEKFKKNKAQVAYLEQEFLLWKNNVNNYLELSGTTTS